MKAAFWTICVAALAAALPVDQGASPGKKLAQIHTRPVTLEPQANHAESSSVFTRIRLPRHEPDPEDEAILLLPRHEPEPEDEPFVQDSRHEPETKHESALLRRHEPEPAKEPMKLVLRHEPDPEDEDFTTSHQ